MAEYWLTTEDVEDLVTLCPHDDFDCFAETGDALRFTTVKDYEDWIARLNSFPAYMDQTIALLRQGMREHMQLPKVIMQRIPGQVAKQMVSEPTKSAFYDPLRRMPADVGLAGSVLRELRPVRTGDMPADPRTWNASRSRDLGLHSWLGAPLADRSGAA